MDDETIDILVTEMIEGGFLDPEDDVLIQETREQIAAQLTQGDLR